MTVTLRLPEENAIVSSLTDEQLRFLACRNEADEVSEEIDWLNLIRKGDEFSLPRPILCAWELSEPPTASDSVLLFLSQSKDFSDAKSIFCSENRCKLYHLFLGERYYWKVAVLRKGELLSESAPRQFTLSSQPPRVIGAGGLSNVRDVGGFVNQDGKRIRQGLIYRGCELEFHHTVTEEGKRVLLNELNIRTDLDLRIEATRAKLTSSALGDTADFQLIPCAAYEKFLQEKEIAARIFRLFTERARYPFYVHCWGGADRTGTLIFLLSAVLGVKKEDLYADYEFTSLSIWGKRSVTSDLFQAFWNELNTYGNPNDSIQQKCELFLLSCGITPEEIHTIRQIMTEP